MATTQEATTREVLTHHLTAFGGNDLEAILADYTEDSQVLTATGPLKGLAAIKGMFEDFFAKIPTGCEFGMQQLSVVDNIAYIAWHSKSAVATIPLGTDTFFLEGDKIKLHTVASYVAPE
ncbi:MAG: nuclear transport factor 2 family protein [Hymenobacter sp.]|nr:MAG: nuclear transport factor 2 family protein [Hymenobacter sp.]